MGDVWHEILMPDSFSGTFGGKQGGGYLAAPDRVITARGRYLRTHVRAFAPSPPGLTCLVQGRMCSLTNSLPKQDNNQGHYCCLQRLRHKSHGQRDLLKTFQRFVSVLFEFSTAQPSKQTASLQTVSTTRVKCREQRQSTAEASCFQLFFS